ncbi:MAG: hypothetical protein ACFFCD_08660 [Promethearchaeota archaeon]
MSKKTYEKDKIISTKTLGGIAAVLLVIGIFIILANPYIGISMIFVGIGSLIYTIKAQKRGIETLAEEDFVDYLRTRVKKNKGIAIWYNIEEDVSLSNVKVKYLLHGNTGRADGVFLARIAAVMTPQWDVATFIFDFKDWVTKSNIEDVVKSTERYLLEKKLKFAFIVVNGRGFERLAKDAAVDLRTREIGLVLTDPNRKVAVQADTWLSKQILKMIKLKDFKVKKTKREFD